MDSAELSVPGSVAVFLLPAFRGKARKPPSTIVTAAEAVHWEAMADAFLAAARRRRKATTPVRVALGRAEAQGLRHELTRARSAVTAAQRSLWAKGGATRRSEAKLTAVLRHLSRLERRLHSFVQGGELPKPGEAGRKPAAPRHAPEVVLEAEALVQETVKLCARILRRKSSDLPLPPGWRPKVKISWNPQRRTSRGGRAADGHYGGHGGVSLALARHVPLDGKGGGKLAEYSHIADDPTIGSFVTADWRHVVRAVAAHEVAHAAQYVIARNRRGRHRLIEYKRAHGQGFQNLYALLRRETVNPHLKAERAAAASEGAGTGSSDRPLCAENSLAIPPP